MSTPPHTFKKNDIAIHPQAGECKVLEITTDSHTASVRLQGVIGAVPTNILKPKITIQKPNAESR